MCDYRELINNIEFYFYFAYIPILILFDINKNKNYLPVNANKYKQVSTKAPIKIAMNFYSLLELEPNFNLFRMLGYESEQRLKTLLVSTGDGERPAMVGAYPTRIKAAKNSFFRVATLGGAFGW